MSQSGYTPIQLYRTTTAAAAPTSGNLAAGELAINLTDEKLYFKNAAGTVKLLAANVTPVTNGGTGTTTAFTTGSVVFAGASGVYSQDNANLFWDNTNDRLGIGTATPGSALQVNGDTRLSNGTAFATGNSLIRSIQSMSGSSNQFVSNSIDFYTAAFTDNGQIAFSTGTVERMRIDGSGNVGIGTTSPAYRFDVRSGATATAIYVNSTATTAYSATSYNGTGARMFLVGGNSSGATNGIQFTQGGSSELFFGGVQEAGGAASFVFQGYNGSAYAERMRIDSSGNVGIGTTSPTVRADVLGVAVGNSAVQPLLQLRSATDALSNSVEMLLTPLISGQTRTAIGGVREGATANASIYFATNNTEQFRILSTGGITSANLVDAVGYKGLPQNSQTASYTLALADMGKMINTTTGGVVIPANASVAFPIGSAISIFNNSGSNQTISITSDTLRLAGTATTGSRTLAQYGIATCVKVAATTWAISGNVT
jgi:hypothetical protein